MKSLSATFLLILTPLVAIGQEAKSEPYPQTLHAGYIRKDHTRINLNLGIEQWEEGKRVDFRLQLWDLSCTSPDIDSGQRLPFNTWCGLKRIVMDKYPGEERRIIAAHDHYISEGTLKLTNVDLLSGKLDFSVVLTDNSTIEVMMRFKRWRNSIGSDDLFLESFRAVGIARGFFSDTLEAIEYRIPEYSYNASIPVEITGMKTAATKVSDDFEASLSKTDLEELKKLGSTLFDFESAMKKALPDYDKVNKGERDLAKADVDKFGSIMSEQFTARIRQSTLSADGKQKTQAFLGNILRKMLEDMRKDLDNEK